MRGEGVVGGIARATSVRLIPKLARRRVPQFTPQQLLAARPVRNALVQWTQDEAGMVTLTIERRADVKTRLLAVVFPIPPRRRLELDDLGSEVWEMCDGEVPLREMMERVARKHKLSLREAEQSLRKFLNDLAQRGLVGFKISEPAVEPASPQRARDHARRRNARRKKKSK